MPIMRPVYSSMVTTPILPQKGYTVKAILIKQIPFKMPIVQLPLDFIYGAGVHGAYFPYNKQGYYKRRNGEPLYYDKSVVSAGVDDDSDRIPGEKIAPLQSVSTLFPIMSFTIPDRSGLILVSLFATCSANFPGVIQSL
ncbi:MAG: hypothetical protein IPP38_10290 [Bacteroidetes bacterium]|nr:hypothetical protein [Bacteroidota bacterium]